MLTPAFQPLAQMFKSSSNHLSCTVFIHATDMPTAIGGLMISLNSTGAAQKSANTCSLGTR
jgi:hypothetical protein